jgi:homoserine kinase type II
MSVYTTIENDELVALLGHYQVGELVDYQGISDGIENTNYFVDTASDAGNHRFVLTLFEHHTLDEMQYYLKLMHHLAEHGVPSADPVADRDGNYISTFKRKPTALVQRLGGSSIIDTTVAQCEQLGAAMGKMHSAGLSFDSDQPNPRGPGWRAETAALLADKLPEDDRRLLAAEVAFEKEHRNIDIPRGVIHADLFRDNALWDGDRLSGIIDFYYACDDALLYDLAIVANDWCCNSDYSLNRDKTAALLGSYNQHRAFTELEQRYWPVMLRSGALRFWCSRLYDMHFPRPGELVTKKNPDEFRSIVRDRSSRHDEYMQYWIA